jgi:Uncharacterized protein conserved in bacteria
MIEATARVPTERAEAYLVRLCRHFAHKVPVEQGEGYGRVRFVCGEAQLAASADRLDIRLVAPDAAQLEQTRDVVESHLLRFAFREGELSCVWSEAGPARADRGDD